jgi:hypothetical protein
MNQQNRLRRLEEANGRSGAGGGERLAPFTLECLRAVTDRMKAAHPPLALAQEALGRASRSWSPETPNPEHDAAEEALDREIAVADALLFPDGDGAWFCKICRRYHRGG